jgi:hypothetical protein
VLSLRRLLAVDAALILSYVAGLILLHSGVIDRIPGLLRLSSSGSLASIWLYLKWLVIVVLLVRVTVARPNGATAAVAAVFALLFFDDALELHEQWGDILAERFDLVGFAGAQADDVGELIVIAVLGTVCVALLLAAYLAASVGMRRWLAGLALLIVALGFFGVALDLLHALLEGADGGAVSLLETAMGVAEDGGELVVGSFILAHAGRLWLGRREIV